VLRPDRSWIFSCGNEERQYACIEGRDLLLGLLMALLFAACGGDSNPTGSQDHLPKGTYIDEPLVLDASPLLAPTRIDDDTFGFDLSGVPLAVTDSLNEILVRYVAPTCLDEIAYVLDPNCSAWRQFSYGHSRTSGCSGPPTQFSHLFSPQGLNPAALVGDRGELEIRGNFSYPEIRALRIHPEYDVTPFPRNTAYMAYASGSFFIHEITPRGDSVFEFDPQKGILGSVPLPRPYPQAVAWDGSSFWVTFSCCVADDQTSWAYRLTPSGEVLCDFPLGVLVAGGMASDGAHLWFVGQQNHVRSVFACDIDKSCDQGSAEIEFQAAIPGDWASAIAWDGSNLLVAGDKLYQFTAHGTQLGASYSLQVDDIRDMAWDGQRLCILNSGLEGYGGSERVVSKFWLR